MRRIKRVNHKRKILQCQQLLQDNKKNNKLYHLLVQINNFLTEKGLLQFLRKDNYKLLQKATKTKLLYQI